MVTKQKQCTSCLKYFPTLYKNTTIDKIKHKLCSNCWFKIQKSLIKLKKEKVKIKKQITKKAKSESLDSLLTEFQRIIRLLGSKNCSTCGKNFEEHGLSACGGHVISRKLKSTSFLVVNVYPQCSRCNFKQKYNKGLEYIHCKHADKYWEEGTAERLIKMSAVPYSFNLGERKEMFCMLSVIEERFKQGENGHDLLTELKQWQERQEWYQTILSKII